MVLVLWSSLRCVSFALPTLLPVFLGAAGSGENEQGLEEKWAVLPKEQKSKRKKLRCHVVYYFYSRVYRFIFCFAFLQNYRKYCNSLWIYLISSAKEKLDSWQRKKLIFYTVSQNISQKKMNRKLFSSMYWIYQIKITRTLSLKIFFLFIFKIFLPIFHSCLSWRHYNN